MTAVTCSPPGIITHYILTHSIFMFTFTKSQQILPKFAPNSHSVITPVRVTCTCILHYVSNKYEVSTAFQFRVTFYCPNTYVLWLLGKQQECALEQALISIGVDRVPPAQLNTSSVNTINSIINT